MDKFDGTKGFKNISYSVWWIRQMILEALNKRNSIEAEDLPSDDDSKETIADNDDYQINDENLYNETFVDEDSDEKLKTEEQIKCIINLMGTLTDREQTIVKMYYGICGHKQHNLEEIRKCIEFD